MKNPQAKGMGYEKRYVGMNVRFEESGKMTPLTVLWEDGREIPVDRVLSFGRAPSHVGSVMPVRYVCLIGGRERELYFESVCRRWFVEIKYREDDPAQRSE